MEKVLNQEEIDAMVQASRSGDRTDIPPVARPAVELWDVHRAGQIGREQLQAITQLHEGFARNLTHALGAYLRVVFSATLVSAEHLTYREFLQHIPETTYLSSCRLDPMGANAALQLDLKIAFPMVDLLLGGEGKGGTASREITEIEEQILDSVVRIVCRELGAAWSALSLEVVFEERLEPGAAQRLMLAEEKTLSLSFEIVMAEVRGSLNLAVPATVSNALLRKMSDDWSHRRPVSGDQSRQRLMRLLLECPFQAEFGAGDMKASVRALAQLAPGDVFCFARNAAEPASLLISGREMFRAIPSRRGNTRSARVLQVVADAGSSSTNVKEKS